MADINSHQFRFQRNQFPDLGGSEWIAIYDKVSCSRVVLFYTTNLNIYKNETDEVFGIICQQILKITPRAQPNHNDVKSEWRTGYLWRPVCRDANIRPEYEALDCQIEDSDGTLQGAGEMRIPTIVLRHGVAARLSEAFKGGRIQFYKGGHTESFNELSENNDPS